MPFPLPSPRITPGPNAFAQRLSLQGDPRFVSQGTHSNIPLGNSPNQDVEYLYSPSIYSAAPSHHPNDVPKSSTGPTSSRTQHSSSSAKSLSSATGLLDKNKDLPPNPASRLAEQVRDSPSSVSRPDGVFPSANTNSSHEQRDHRWLEPIIESNATWRSPVKSEHPKPVARLDMKLAKADGTGMQSQLRAVSSEANVRSKTPQTDATPKRKFLERIRGFPVKPTYPANYSSDKIASRSVTPVQGGNLPNKAARVLGASIDRSYDHQAQATVQRQYRAPSVEDKVPHQSGQRHAQGQQTVLPSFGELDLPEPTPPFTRDHLNVRRNRDMNSPPMDQAYFSPRMMRESSDHRLLLLNDRIISNSSDTQSNTTPPDAQNSRQRAVDHHDHHGRPAALEPPPSPLRRIRQRIGNDDGRKPFSGSQAAEESVHNFDPYQDRDMDIRIRSGFAKQPVNFAGGDTQITLSVCGSLHETSSSDTGLYTGYQDGGMNAMDGKSEGTSSGDTTPESHWPIIFRNRAERLRTGLSPDESQSTFHASVSALCE